jgi:hypothetical protein
LVEERLQAGVKPVGHGADVLVESGATVNLKRRQGRGHDHGMAVVRAAVLAVAGCRIVNFDLGESITPSNVIISENRDVSGFDAIEFSTFGKVNIMQGDTESLNISGPDNLVPLVSTR